MMKIVIENKGYSTLKVGDLLMDSSGNLSIVVEDGLTNREQCRYKIKRIDEVYSGSQLSEATLEKLTAKAIKHNFDIYSQDDYDLVIRRKTF